MATKTSCAEPPANRATSCRATSVVFPLPGPPRSTFSREPAAELIHSAIDRSSSKLRKTYKREPSKTNGRRGNCSMVEGVATRSTCSETACTQSDEGGQVNAPLSRSSGYQRSISLRSMQVCPPSEAFNAKANDNQTKSFTIGVTTPPLANESNVATAENCGFETTPPST